MGLKQLESTNLNIIQPRMLLENVVQVIKNTGEKIN